MDLQGFQVPINEFVVKEIAVVDVKSDYYVTHLFEPPFDWNLLSAKYKCTNKWLTRNFRNLKWENGYFPFKILKEAEHYFAENYHCALKNVQIMDLSTFY